MLPPADARGFLDAGHHRERVCRAAAGAVDGMRRTGEADRLLFQFKEGAGLLALSVKVGQHGEYDLPFHRVDLFI